jgi:hypothetical protein
MVHGRPYTPEFRSFDCHGKAWPEVLDLGKQFGWVPEGTRDGDNDPTFEPTYDPEDWAHSKLISGRDASNLAAALTRAKDLVGADDGARTVLLSDDMTESEFRAVNRGISPEFLGELADFLRSGEIRFAWDD